MKINPLIRICLLILISLLPVASIQSAGKVKHRALEYANPTCYIYGYTDNQLVASVENAIIGNVAFQSFEDNTTGGWTFNASGIQSVTGIRSVTGKKYYTLTVGQITKSFSPSPGKNIIVSYWSRSGAQLVNGAGPAQTGRSVTVEGYTWTYYEHLLTNPSSVYVSGSGIIDELRLYPEEASMTSYTYEPLVGTTTKCDINNNILYYEYDLFNRLSIVRGPDYRILNKYCYGNAGQQEDCSGQLFYSVEKTSNYTRNNCGTGYAGSTVTYTVPAGTYVSSIGQTAANQMAQDDLDANGLVYANINGVCSFIYYSADYSNYYYSESCGQGQTPVSIYVNVPQGSYSSTVSQQDANNQALQYAQNYANQYGTCASDITLNYNNSTYGATFYVTLTNTSTYEQSYFEIYGFGSGVLGNIPAGNYDIEINNYSSGYYFFSVGCGYDQSGSYAYFYNIPLYPGCSTISIN